MDSGDNRLFTDTDTTNRIFTGMAADIAIYCIHLQIRLRQKLG